MNRAVVNQDDHKIYQVSPGCWKFPEQITIFDTEIYHEIDNAINLNDEIVFDLTETNVVPSAFVGYMMDVNKRANNNGGCLQIKASHSMERLLSLLELKDFFSCS